MARVLLLNRDHSHIVLYKTRTRCDVPTTHGVRAWVDISYLCRTVTRLVVRDEWPCLKDGYLNRPLLVCLYRWSYKDETERSVRDRSKQCFLLEPSGEEELVLRRGFVWVPLSSAPDMVRASCHSFLYQRIRELESDRSRKDVLSYLPVYSRRGFYIHVTRWAEDALAKSNLNCKLNGSFVQDSVGFESSILMAYTTAKPIYCKVCKETYPEALMTSVAARLFPQYVVQPIAVNVEQNMILTFDFEGSVDDSLREKGWNRDMAIESRQMLLPVLGSFQLESLAHIEELRALNWPETSLERFLEDYENFITALHDKGCIRKEQLVELTQLAPLVKFLCNELMRDNIPCSLCHGDASLGNVTSTGGTLQLFDFYRSSLGHPFLDISCMPIKNPRHFEPYLKLWEKYQPLYKSWESLRYAGLIWDAWDMYREFMESMNEPLDMLKLTFSGCLDGFIRRLQHFDNTINWREPEE